MAIAIAAGIAAIGGIAQAGLGAKSAKDAAAAQEAAALRNIGLSEDFVAEYQGILAESASARRGAIDDFRGSFRRTPNATEFIDDAIDLEQKGFDFQTGLKRENLDFILGDTQENLRETQGDFTRLAAGDFSDFKAELNASLSGAQAEAFGSPVGTTFNIAARDRFNFRTSGLSNAMGISDFFAAEGTIDPPNPVTSAFGLADFEQRENSREEQHNQFLLGSILDTEESIFNSNANIGIAGLNAATSANNAIGSLGGVGAAGAANVAGAVGQAGGSIMGFLQQQQAADRQDRLVDAQISAMRSGYFTGVPN